MQVLPRVFLLMWITGLPCCMSVVAVHIFTEHYKIASHEMHDGAYTPLQYWVVTSAVDAVMAPLLSLSCAGVSLYVVSNFEWSAASQVLLLHALQLWIFETLARTLAVLTRSSLLGILVLITLWFLSFLFSGILLRDGDVPSPLAWMCDIFPTRWVIRSMVNAEFFAMEFAGADVCDHCTRGFRCPTPLRGVHDDYEMRIFQCFGIHGRQVVQSLQTSFKVLDARMPYAHDVFNLLREQGLLQVLHLTALINRNT
jgi:hypothetical protein